MVIKPRQTGVVATCECGSKQFVPSESAIRTGILYCPCGHLEKIEMKTFNQIMAKNFRIAASKKSGRPLRSTGKSEERHRNYRDGERGIRKQMDIHFEPLS